MKNKSKSYDELFYKRLRAFLIDFAISIWLYAIFRLIRNEKIQVALGIFDTPITMFIMAFSLMLFFAFWIFKAHIYKNKSIGMKIMKIEIISKDEKLPSSYQLTLKGVFNFFLYPIEMVLFLLNIELLGDRISNTYVRKILE